MGESTTNLFWQRCCECGDFPGVCLRWRNWTEQWISVQCSRGWAHEYLLRTPCSKWHATKAPNYSDNSKAQDNHLQLIRRWNLEEINELKYLFRAPILASIRMLIWKVLTEKGVNSIFLVNTKSLDQIRPQMIRKRQDRRCSRGLAQCCGGPFLQNFFQQKRLL